MHLCRCPDRIDKCRTSNYLTSNVPSVFMAGGITNCERWQDRYVESLSDEAVLLLDPRRYHFDVTATGIQEEQIAWEYYHLMMADAISFWFSPETLCPITLLELGKWLVQPQGMTARPDMANGGYRLDVHNKPLFIGVHPDYQRKDDVVIQTRLARPDVRVVFSLNELTDLVKGWLK